MSTKNHLKIENRDFAKFYGIQDALNIGYRAVEDSTSIQNAVFLAMEAESEHNGFSIKRIMDRRGMLFGRDGENMIAPYSRDLITLSNDTSDEIDPEFALRYGVFPEEVVIGYVQTHSFIDNIKKYQSLKRKLGVRPHELLVAQFLARIAPIMDMRPQTKLLLEESSLSSRKTIRDRFFDKEWSLNPNKERVHQIFGEDNRWLEPEAIKARRNELRRQNSGSFF